MMTNKKLIDRDRLIKVKNQSLQITFILFRYVLLITLGFVILTPLLKMLKTAITSPQALGMNNTAWIPAGVSSEQFKVAAIVLNYWQSLAYSIGNTMVIVALQVFSAALAGYSFARIKFRGSGLLFALVLFTIVVPQQSIMLAQYICFRNFDIFGIIELISGKNLNLLSSPVVNYVLAATGMGVKSGLFIYIFRQSFRNMPVSIEEAAFVDGAGFLKTFLTIVLPMSSSSVTTVGVLSFVWNYGDTYYTSLLNPTKLHLAMGLSKMYGNVEDALKLVNNQKLIPIHFDFWYGNPMYQNAVASAASLLVIVPLLVIYLFIQRRFVQGVERSGLGGE